MDGYLFLEDPEEEIMYLYFYPEENLFRDGGGFIIENLLDIITSNELYLFRQGVKQEFFHRFYSSVEVFIERPEDII